MRRIEFIAPVEAMRGNLSGNQVLQYAQNYNPAFDAPEGRQYARNYQPRYIGAKRAASGLKLFSVKTKAATLINSASLLRMALLGGSGALYAAVTRNASVMTQAEGVYAYDKSIGLTKDSFRKWLQDNLRMVLANKMDAFIASASGSQGTFRVQIDNPWVKTSGAPNCPVSNETLVKFWLQLATNPVLFKVDNYGVGVAHFGEDFAGVIAGNHNVLGMTEATSTAIGQVVKIGESWLQNYTISDPTRIAYVTADTDLEGDANVGFRLTNVNPDAE